MFSRSVSTESVGAGEARETYFWSLSLRDLVFIALIAALSVLGKLVIRGPLHIPGHSGVLWVALFVICRGLIDKRGTGVVLGLVTGVLATFAGLGNTGPLEWLKWLSAGAMLEVLTLALPGDLRSWLKAGLVGACVHLGKLVGLTLAGIILRIPFSVLFLGLGLSVTTHIIFGVVGGLLGALVLRELRKVPFLDSQARKL
jgi:hypothetical protein